VQWLVTSPEDLAVLVEINRGASDRALAIVAASLIEIHLTKLIKQALIDNAKVEQMLFRSSGPLGAFATKIRLAYKRPKHRRVGSDICDHHDRC